MSQRFRHKDRVASSPDVLAFQREVESDESAESARSEASTSTSSATASRSATPSVLKESNSQTRPIPPPVVSPPQKRGHRRSRSTGNFPQTLNLAVSDFELGELLGRGSYAKVLKARYRGDGRDFAVKIMDKRHIVRENKTKYVQIERTVLTILQHPNIVKLHCSFMDSTKLYFMLDLASGDMRKLLQTHGTLCLEASRFFTAEMLYAVEYMHSKGILHRDIKPENWLTTASGHLLLTDFGSAKILRAHSTVPQPDDQAVDEKTFCGTAEYVSPEMLNSTDFVAGSDLWAIGCCVFQFFAGHSPFRSSTEFKTFQRIIELDYSLPELFPPDGADLVQQILVTEPSQRIGCAADGHLSRAGYKLIKSHDFFDGLDFDRLPLMTPPPSRPHLSPPPICIDHEHTLESLDEAFETDYLLGTSPPQFNTPAQFRDAPTQFRDTPVYDGSPLGRRHVVGESSWTSAEMSPMTPSSPIAVAGAAAAELVTASLEKIMNIGASVMKYGGASSGGKGALERGAKSAPTTPRDRAPSPPAQPDSLLARAMGHGQAFTHSLIERAYPWVTPYLPGSSLTMNPHNPSEPRVAPRPGEANEATMSHVRRINDIVWWPASTGIAMVSAVYGAVSSPRSPATSL